MVIYLVDTNILTRVILIKDPRSAVAVAAIDVLKQREERLVLAPQNLIEFWAAATRPVEANGLGLPVERVREEVTRFERMFRVVEEPPGTFRRWRQLVENHGVKGRQVFDARLAAVMIESGIENILTFNVDDFRRYAGITAVNPHSLLGAGKPPAPGGPGN